MRDWLRYVPGAFAIARWRRFRRSRRLLRKEIGEIERAYQADFDAAKNGDDYQQVNAMLLGECRQYDQQLDALEWNELLRKASRFGLDVPGVVTRNVKYQALRQRITEARFRYWERWAVIVIPALSLLVALTALLWPRGDSPN